MSKFDAVSEFSLERICVIMGWRHEKESVKIKNLFLLECSMQDCCYRDPLGVSRTVSVEWYVSGESISQLCRRLFDSQGLFLRPRNRTGVGFDSYRGW